MVDWFQLSQGREILEQKKMYNSECAMKTGLAMGLWFLAFCTAAADASAVYFCTAAEIYFWILGHTDSNENEASVYFFEHNREHTVWNFKILKWIFQFVGNFCEIRHYKKFQKNYFQLCFRVVVAERTEFPPTAGKTFCMLRKLTKVHLYLEILQTKN